MIRSKYLAWVSQVQNFFAVDQSKPVTGGILAEKPSLQSAVFAAQSDEFPNSREIFTPELFRRVSYGRNYFKARAASKGFAIDLM